MVEKCIDEMTSLEKIADNERSLQVVVHCFIATLAESLYEFVGFSITVAAHRNAIKVVKSIHQSFIPFLGSLQSLIGEVDSTAIMRRKDEETNCHRRIGLRETRMISREELLQSNEVSKALSHLLTIDRNHVVMHPIVHHLVTLTGNSLGNLTFMVWKYKIHATTMNIEMTAEIFPSHSRTLAMPTWEAYTPWAGPTHDVFGLRLFP